MPSPSPLVVASAVLVVLAVVFQSFAPPPPSPSAIKLTYFDAPGRAEASRVALRLGGVPFEDERLARDAFLQLKPSLPFGQVPVVTVDGETFAESQAILRYAGRVAGQYPSGSNPVDALLIDELLTALDEVSETHITPTRREKDPEKQRLMREAAVAGPLPAALERLEKRLQVVTSMAFFKPFGGQVLLHEVAVWRFVSSFRSGTIDHIPSTITDGYETMNAIHAKVEQAIAVVSARAASPSRSRADVETAELPKSLKLTYFDFPGRAEPLRLALHIGGVAFEDERLSPDAFLERKPTLPYGQVPVLTVDGVQVAQTFALLRFAGALGGLYPANDPVEALKVDEIIARVEDVYYALAPSGAEKDQDKKRAMREQLAAERLPTMLALLDKRLAYWKKGAAFALGDKISVADLAVLNVVQILKSGRVDFVPATITDAFETLGAVHDAVLAHPRVVDWYARDQ